MLVCVGAYAAEAVISASELCNRANPENDSLQEIKKFSTKFDDIGVIIMRKRYSIQQGEKR